MLRQIDFEGRRYEVTVVDDLERDGMWFELWDETVPHQSENVLGIFYCDADDRITFSSFRHDLPLELVEWAVREARERLTPIRE